MPGSLEPIVAVAVDNIRVLQAEIGRVRERLHRLESGQEGVRLLRQNVTELHDQLPNLARQAAREAVSEDRRRRHADWFSNLRTYAAVFSAGAAVAGLLVAFLLR